MLKINPLDNIYHEDSSTVLKTRKRSIYAVGYERGGHFIIARDDLFVKRTCIELINVHSQLRKQLYVHKKRVKVVHASVNESHKLLTFTIKEVVKRKINGGGTETRPRFTTCFVELSSKKFFEFSPKTETYQHIQFLGCVAKKKQQWEFILFLHHPEKIDIYKLERVKDPYHPDGPIQTWGGNGTFLWYDWDPEERELAFIVRRNQRKRVFKILDFSKPFRPVVKLKYTYFETNENFMCAFPTEEIKPNVFVVDHMEKIKKKKKARSLSANPWLNAHVVEDTSKMNFRLLRSGKIPICLCAQNYCPDQSAIHFCVYMFNHMYKYEYSFRIGEYKFPTKKARLNFFLLDRILVVLLPGRFMQMIDVSLDHVPWPIFENLGIGRNLPIPSTKFHISLSVSSSNHPMMKRKIYSYNLKNGNAYKVEFDLLKMLSVLNTKEDFIDFLHLVVSHIRLKDEKFLTKVLERTFECNREDLMNHIFVEFLIASSYLKIKNFLTQQINENFSNSMNQFIHLIVMSGKEKTMTKHTRNPHFFKMNNVEKNVQVRELKYYVLEGLAQTMDYSRHQAKISEQSKYEEMETFQQNKNNASKKKISFFQNVKNFFSLGNIKQISRAEDMHDSIEEDDDDRSNDKNIELGEIQTDKYRIFSKKTFFQNYLRELNLAFPHIVMRDKIIVSKNYMLMIGRQTNILYKMLRRSYKENEASMFNLMKCLYTALVETKFPPPTFFIRDFALLGMKILHPRIFVQHVKESIFVVTQELIMAIVISKKFTKDQINFFISRLYEKHVDFYVKINIDEDSTPLIEHFHHTLHSSTSTRMRHAEDVRVYMNEKISNQDEEFLPQYYFMKSLTIPGNTQGLIDNDERDEMLRSIKYIRKNSSVVLKRFL